MILGCNDHRVGDIRDFQEFLGQKNVVPSDIVSVRVLLKIPDIQWSSGQESCIFQSSIV